MFEAFHVPPYVEPASSANVETMSAREYDLKRPVRYAEDKKGLLYEIHPNGERVLIRSTESETRAFIRFTNRTSRPCDVWWRDFQGVRHHYICLGPGSFTDVNTFLNHPWHFRDPLTQENFVVNNTLIYRVPQQLGGKLIRTNWNITVSVRTLKFSALLAVAHRVESSVAVRRLGLPRVLEDHLRKLVKNIQIEIDADNMLEDAS